MQTVVIQRVPSGVPVARLDIGRGEHNPSVPVECYPGTRESAHVVIRAPEGLANFVILPFERVDTVERINEVSLVTIDTSYPGCGR